MTTFTEGQLVCLKSNPEIAMTVSVYNHLNGKVTTNWFDKQGVLNKAVFLNSVLQKYCPKENVPTIE